MSGPSDALITCRNLKRTYPLSIAGGVQLELSFPDILIPAGRRIALLGVSGSGKSTLLNLVAGLDAPDRDGSSPPSIIYRFSDGTLADMANTAIPFPRDRLGFMFQEGHLITDASAGINAALPSLLNGISCRDSDLREFMDALKLPPEAAGREAWRLSGGQKQRVALLRALFHQPQIIFADEPTSSLDKRSAEAIMRLLVEYQQQVPSRTLFWVTHDLQLASDFATDFLIVRKPDGQPVELEGPLANPGRDGLAEIERKVYTGAAVLDAKPPTNLSERTQGRGEIRFTQAKVGSSLTFARRDTRQSLFQLKHMGRWMASIEGRPPPVVKGFLDLYHLYKRFSDHAVAGAVMMSVLMLGFVFLGLTTMKFFRDQAMSDPNSCNIMASAPDASMPGAVGMELTPSLITTINNEAPWRSSSEVAFKGHSWLDWSAQRTRQPLNPCGDAPDLVFGRNTALLTLYIERDGQCIRIGTSPKTLVANLAEPAILAAKVRLSTGISRPLAEVLPQGRSSLQGMAGMALTGEEIFVTEAFQEQINLDPDVPKVSSGLTSLPLCIPGMEGRQLRIGGVVSGLPQPRGLPYLVLVAHGSPWLSQSDSYEQAVFYTDPERAAQLAKYLREQRFAFSRDEVERMTAAANRFAAIHQLIWLVGGIMVIATFLFLLSCVGAFLEKNARPNAVLRAYGLTKTNLRRQIYWRLGAVSLYALGSILFAGSALGIALYFLFTAIELPLPSLSDILQIGFLTLLIAAIEIFVVVRLAVWLWWREDGNIAQELN